MWRHQIKVWTQRIDWCLHLFWGIFHYMWYSLLNYRHKLIHTPPPCLFIHASIFTYPQVKLRKTHFNLIYQLVNSFQYQCLLLWVPGSLFFRAAVFKNGISSDCLILSYSRIERKGVFTFIFTWAISSRQLKIYLRASLDLMFVSDSCSSGVCKIQ